MIQVILNSILSRLLQTTHTHKPFHIFYIYWVYVYEMHRKILKTRRDAKFLIRLVSVEPSIINFEFVVCKYVAGLLMLLMMLLLLLQILCIL